MLIFNQMTDYAIVLVRVLATAPAGGYLSGQAVASHSGLPYPTSSKLLKILSKNGIACSEQGPQGGYRLAKPLADISLWEVMQAVDGGSVTAKCLDQPEVCAHAGTCQLQSQWQALHHLFQGVLQAIDFEQLKQPLAAHPVVRALHSVLQTQLSEEGSSHG